MLPECFMYDDILHHLLYERNSKEEYHHKKIKFYFLKKIQYVTTNDNDYMPDNMILCRQRRWIILFFNIFLYENFKKRN